MTAGLACKKKETELLFQISTLNKDAETRLAQTNNSRIEKGFSVF